MRYRHDALPEGEWEEFRKVAITRAMQMNEDFEVETIDGNIAKGCAGDYLCVDSAGHPYPANRHVFIASHAPVSWDEDAAA